MIAFPWAKYTCDVDETTMRGGRLWPTKVETNVPPADTVIVKYGKGQVCDVHYNPTNPAESVLEPGVVDRRYRNNTMVDNIFVSTIVFLLDSLVGICNFTCGGPFYE